MLGKFSIILFLFFSTHTFAGEGIKIISSSPSSLIIEYRPIYNDSSQVRYNNIDFVKIGIAGGIIAESTKFGDPEIQHITINVGVPSRLGNTLRILATEYSSLSGLLSPFPKPIRFENDKDLNYSLSDEYYKTSETPLVSFGEFGFVRELPVQSVEITPIQFDAVNHTIKLFKRILFQIDFGTPKQLTKIVEENYLKNIIVNFDVAKGWGMKDLKLKKPGISLLADGIWYRFEAPVEGIYKIDRAMLLSYGIDAGTVDPRTIKIYNNGGYELPEDMDSPRPDGLNEIAIKIFGEEDGRFDQNDYILFYGRGTDFWQYNTSLGDIVRNKHHFSKQNYYWITSGGSNGKRITDKVSLAQTEKFVQSSTPAYKLIEKDLVNIGATGRDYWGDDFTTTTRTRTYINSLGGIIPNSTVEYGFRFANASSSSIPIRIEENNNTIYSSTLIGYGNSSYVFGINHSNITNYSGSLPDDRSTLKFTITPTSADQKAYMDYVEIKYIKQLKAINDSLIFYSKDTSSVIEYNLFNFTNSNIIVFDISDYANVQIISNAFISGGEYIFQAAEGYGSVKKYLAVTGSNFKTPLNPNLITNSSIRDYQPGTELIIITPRDFGDYAEQLKNYRASQSPYPVSASVFYIDEIFNEFSCGMMDPTAVRDFLKYCYDNWTIKPFYVLLFGSGTYDYFNVENKNNNFIPTYQTEESLYELYSYSTDDYYARVSGNDRKVDLAVGRTPVKTTIDAESYVNKIEVYETAEERSLWKNLITLIADDGLTTIGNDGNLHTRQSENLSNNIIPEHFIQNKIYLANYPAVMTGLGRKKPAVNIAIVNAINNGTLIVNYIGHGNPRIWAHEDVFEKETSIPMLTNDKYFFLTAATCDFGKFDSPTETSSTELMLFLPNAGVIGAFTAARIVLATQNAILNDSLYTNLFRTRDIENLPIRVGTAYFLTKQYRTGDNDEKYYLFCDPTLRLNVPQMPVSIDSVNHSGLDANVQVSALGNVSIKGTVKNVDGSQNNFNGEAIISVFDSKRTVDLPEINYSMTQQGGTIFKGRVSIYNGNFSADFTVPKDISYENQNGKIVAYIFNDEYDGVGFTDKILVGGTDTTQVNDGEGPNIEIYFDNMSYENSFLVNPDFNLLVRLSDDTGLNTTGTGVGHKIEGILNDDEDNPIDFSNYFIGDLDAGGKSGVINYRFSSFEPGDYKIKIKAWDVFNNSSTSEGYFTVVQGGGLIIRDVYNYPNPFSSNTSFTFQHNLNESINVKIKIYTIAGRLIREIESRNIDDKFVRIDWDGRDEDRNELANGTYLYKLIVETSSGEYKENILGKLAVIR